MATVVSVPDYVRIVPRRLPAKVRAFSVLCDGYYTIIINDTLGYKAQRDALAHELAHITRGDFQRLDVQMIEETAHRYNFDEDK